MDRRRELTETVRHLLSEPPPFEYALQYWWYDFKSQCLRLSLSGFNAMVHAKLPMWTFEIGIPNPYQLLNLSRKLTCAYFISQRGQKASLVLFGSKEAMLFTLYNDINRFLRGI